MSKLKSELTFLKIQLNSHYGTSVISTSTTIRRVIEIKKIIKKIEQRKNKILSLKNG
jgi:predicted thioesterase